MELHTDGRRPHILMSAGEFSVLKASFGASIAQSLPPDQLLQYRSLSLSGIDIYTDSCPCDERTD